MDVVINYLLNDGLHRLDILNLIPVFYQISTDLVDGVLHRSILRMVWQTANNMVSVIPHSLVNLWSIV